MRFPPLGTGHSLMAHFRRLWRPRCYILIGITSLALLFCLTAYKEIKTAGITFEKGNIDLLKVSRHAISILGEVKLRKSKNLSTYEEHLFENSSFIVGTDITRKNMPPAISHKIYGQHINDRVSSEEQLVVSSANNTLESIVKRRYGWVIRQNYLPNFYLVPMASKKQDNQQKKIESDVYPLASGRRQLYSSSVVVFLHHNKAAGSSTKMCLKKIASDNQPIEITQTDIHQMSVRVGPKLFPENLRRVMTGDYSFGLCDHIKNNCAYFTYLRNPWNRLISSYKYCRHRISDQLCSALNASNVSIKEWAHHQGSFFFRQLIYNPDFCSSLQKERVETSLNHLYPTPCWYKQKVNLDKFLTKPDLELILSYVLENLEKWFAVIGLVEDYSTSTELLQDAFDLPFHSLCASDIFNSGQMWLQTKEWEKLYLELINDPTVNEVMSYDLRIYRAAQNIFRRQKEIYLERKPK